MDHYGDAEGGPMIVCYHYPCIDGIFSALAAYLSLGSSVSFFPLTVYKQHSVSELNLKGNETVFMCDFTGPSGFVEEVAAIVKRVVVLDHHKTAIELLTSPKVTLAGNVDISHLDLNRSGATIARDYFQPVLNDSLRDIYRFVEDADLWRWALKDSREFHSGMIGLGLEFDVNKNPTIFETLQSLSISDIVESGRCLRAEEDRCISKAMGSAFRVQLGGDQGRAKGLGVCLAVMVEDGMEKIRSRMGNELAMESRSQGLKAIGIIAYREGGMEDTSLIKLSLRGHGHDVDTTSISVEFGGGGHRLASSCIVSTSVFNAWRIPLT